ncbi:MAG: histidine kinase [Sphingomonas bacterium]|nr:histidine kinase [Sphingomonas bacterium]
MYAVLMRWFGTTDRAIRRFLIAAMALGFACLLAAGLAALFATSRTIAHTDSVRHTYEVELAIARASIATEQAEASRRGYLLSGNAAARTNYDKAARTLPGLIETLASLTRDNPVQRAHVAELRRLTADLQQRRAASVEMVASGQRQAAIDAFARETSAQRIAAVRDLTERMTAEENRLMRIRDTGLVASLRAFYAILGIAGVLLVLVGVATLMTLLRYTRDLDKSREAIQDFAESLEELVAERTADLTRANDEIQRFAYIVSHDLRAPLVNVMGFTAELDTATGAIAELIDRAEEQAPDIVTEEARLAAREDLPEAIGFIRTSTEKMDRLINAILKLSREGRRVLSPEPIDMVAMVSGISAMLRHALDDRGAAFSIEGALPAIVSDRLAIEQILSNLIENAVKYLQPGRPGRIIMRGQRSGPRVSLEIEDNGRGIAASDHQRVFDLFRRAGTQDQPGEGIGLAHVRALAYRLGGTIDVRSELGVGTTFRLSLPATLNELQEQPR